MSFVLVTFVYRAACASITDIGERRLAVPPITRIFA